MVEEVQNREVLYSRYKNCFSSEIVKSDGEITYSYSLQNIFTQGDNYRFYFEFYVINNADADSGIQSNYNKKALEKHKKLISHMGELFELRPTEREENLEQHIEDITVHYGIRLLRHIVECNNGYLVGTSPATEALFTQNYYSRERSHGSENGIARYTEWDAIMPIYYIWEQEDENNVKSLSAYDGKSCFGDAVSVSPKQVLYLGCEAVFGYDDAKEKTEAIYLIQSNLENHFKKYVYGQMVALLDIGETATGKIEFFAKALFALIAKQAEENHTQQKLLIAIIMPNMETIQEFVRIFSVFYCEGEQRDMRMTQIALCNFHEAEEDTASCKRFGTVQFMLAGESLSSVMENARLFAYHHAEDTLEHLPIIDYLTYTPETIEIQQSDTELFPFDLFLPNSLPKGGSSVQFFDVNIHNSWFVSRMAYIINSNLREKEYGCRIDNVHVRLGSKVHIDTFFEAELLFHNMGNVSRFAYYIAHSLLNGDEKLQNDGKVLVLGYEKYSDMLIMQIKNILESSGYFDGVYSAVVHDDEEGDVCLKTYFDRKQLLGAYGLSAQIVAVLPVGTTLSTIYKMHNVARRELGWNSQNNGRRADMEHNFCLVLVNSDLPQESGGGSAITKIFWSMPHNPSEQVIEINQENHDTAKSRVRYLIPASAKWYAPEDCRFCNERGKKNRPLIDAKQAKTMPSAIFRLYNHKLERDQEGKNISRLLHYISYSHLCNGNNHFQFYADFQGLYSAHEEHIVRDLLEVSIDRAAFNIVVSPLNENNSHFVKAVIDCVFKGRVRFLHFDISEAYREEIRSKFSYIAQDYKYYKQSNPNAHFRVYYADSSIVTGENLNRARLLLNMLLSQEDSHYHLALFDKIFLFINRCHPDTLKSFVRNVKKDVYRYIDIDVPSYNTNNDFCPACKNNRKYVLMGKRSSTIDLNMEFVRLSKKHDKRPHDDYVAWRHDTIMHSSSHFLWFLQWLYVNVVEDEKKILTYVLAEEAQRYDGSENVSAALYSEYAEHIENVSSYVKEYVECRIENRLGKDYVSVVFGNRVNQSARQEYSRILEGICLADIMENMISDADEKEKFQQSVIKLMCEQVMEVRDYMRVFSMHTSYAKLNAVVLDVNNCSDYPCRRAMLKMIEGKLLGEGDVAVGTRKADEMVKQLKELSDTRKERFIITYNIEWLISFIKVLSREQIAYYYDYRQAIIGIMEDMMFIMQGGINQEKKIAEMKAEDVGWDKILGVISMLENVKYESNRHLCAYYYYQLYMTLVHRISDLKVTAWVGADGAIKILNIYNRLQKRFFQEKPDSPNGAFICLPSMHNLMLRYLKAVKVATMTSDDAIPCLMLADAARNLSERSGEVNPEMQGMFTQISRLLYLENTQMMYVGMKNLNQFVEDNILCMGNAEKVRTLKCSEPAQSFKKYMDELSGVVQRHLENSYSNIDSDAKEEELLRQNVLYNFCSFWHRSTQESPVSKKTAETDKIAYMLQYFRRLGRMSEMAITPENKDLLPYDIVNIPLHFSFTKSLSCLFQ